MDRTRAQNHDGEPDNLTEIRLCNDTDLDELQAFRATDRAASMENLSTVAADGQSTPSNQIVPTIPASSLANALATLLPGGELAQGPLEQTPF